MAIEQALAVLSERLKYTSALKTEINAMIENPPEELVRLLASSLYDGRFTASVKEQFTGLVRSAFKEVIRDSVKSRLSFALADTDQDLLQEAPAEVGEEEVVTTEEEIEGFMIVKAIVREVMPVNRVTLRDARSYCAILIDNNNRKPLARLHFNRAQKYLGLFDGEKEERVPIGSLDNIYEHTDRLRATAVKYAASS